MKQTKRILAVLLVSVLLASALPLAAGAVQMYAINVYTDWMSGNFSPFFSGLSADRDVCFLTQVNLLTTDLLGMVVETASQGAVRTYKSWDYTYYGPASLTITEKKGKTVCDFNLRKDIRFSDGEKLTADDVIFSMYVLADPTYDGQSAFGSLPVEGMAAYRVGMQSLQRLIFADGEGGYKKTAYYTKAQYNAYWAAFNKAGLQLVDGICDYLVGAGYATEKASVAQMAELWGYPLPAKSTKNDFWNAIKQAYQGGDPAAINAETGASDLFTALLDACLGKDADTYHNGVKTGESAATITGIQKLSDYRVRVTLVDPSPSDVYGFSLPIAPMHYYGSRALYDYEKGKFGFVKGDLSSVRAKNGAPMGAGPYRLQSFGNGIALFSAYEGYYLGAPKNSHICFIPNDGSDAVNDIHNGFTDIASPPVTEELLSQIMTPYGFKTIVGVSTVEYPGYGYIGISAEAVKVGDDPGSEASKNLRRAFASVFAYYRHTAVKNYFGSLAGVIEYPTDCASWAAPQEGEEGYRAAFSVDVNGKKIEQGYNPDTGKIRDVASGFLKAAGYTVGSYSMDAEAPEGAKSSYDIWIPGGGTGDHPAYQLAKDAASVLKSLGIKLNIKDLEDSGALWEGLAEGRVDMWCAAWGAAADPDPYQMYFSGSGELPAGSSNYMFDISDDTLNSLILQARSTMKQTVRKDLYKQCLDIIEDWAVTVPFYQRREIAVLRTQSFLSFNGYLTQYYGWLRFADQLEFQNATGDASVAVAWQEFLFAAPDLTYDKLQATESKAIHLYYGDWRFSGDDPVATGMKFAGPGTKSEKTVVVKGDNDGDGKVTTNDARNALRMAIGLDDPNVLQQIASKVAGGPVITSPTLTVTTEDARMILRAAIGLDRLAIV